MPVPTPAATLLPVGFMRVEGDWMPSALLSAASRLAATVSASVDQPASVMTMSAVPKQPSTYAETSTRCSTSRMGEAQQRRASSISPVTKETYSSTAASNSSV